MSGFGANRGHLTFLLGYADSPTDEGFTGMPSFLEVSHMQQYVTVRGNTDKYTCTGNTHSYELKFFALFLLYTFHSNGSLSYSAHLASGACKCSGD